MSAGDSLSQNGQKSSTAIIVAVIGAVAVIAAAVIGFIANRPPTGPPNSGSVVLPDSGGKTALVCAPSGRRYEVAQVSQGSSATEIGITPIAAYSFLDRAARPPQINVSGQVKGGVPAGMSLWLVSHPKADTVDSTAERHPGSSRYYPAGEIKPTENGCWSIPPHSIGYDEALGITFEQILTLVPNSVRTEFLSRPKGSDYDGFDPTFASRSDVRIVGSFDVVTSP